MLLKRFCCRVNEGDIVIARNKNGTIFGLGCVASDPESTANLNTQRQMYWLPWPQTDQLPEPLPQNTTPLSPFRGSTLRWIAVYEQ
jgi:hypothetical protein